MKLNNLIEMMVNNLSALQGQKQQFYSVGDVAGTLEKDNEIAETVVEVYVMTVFELSSPITLITLPLLS